MPEGDSNVRCSGGPMDASEHRRKKTPARSGHEERSQQRLTRKRALRDTRHAEQATAFELVDERAARQDAERHGSCDRLTSGALR